MGTIILFILISVAITIFQSAAQSTKQQKPAAGKTNMDRPRVQPVVRTVGKTAASVGSTGVGNMEGPSSNQKPEDICWGQSFASGEGMQTEALDEVPIPEQKNEHEEPRSLGVLGNFTADELQRSIVISELLGKPKALRR